MAIIQISKIQQRSGNLVDLPQLDEAQFGWANDARRLFIGTTTPNPIENVEVLTSYSNISFSQVEGSGGSNVNITTANLHVGQVLGYDSSLNAWVNTGGNANDPGNTLAYTGLPIHLGTVANVKIGGGATGYVLETDGTGNLNWTSKGTLRTPIIALSNATPIVMTVENTTPYTNGLEITISGANAANANTIVNGQNFFIKVANDFPTTGNVSLYNTAALDTPNAASGTNLGTYTANSGIATASLTGGSSANAGGSVNTIQFNDGGILNGSANFTITGGNIVALTGNFSASNVAGGNLVSANYFTGTLTTAAQPNITSTGTLASLSVSGNANVGNLNTAGNVIASQVTANSNGTGNNFKVGDDAYIGDINITNTMVVKGQQDGANGYIIFGNSDTTSTLGRAGTGPLTYNGAFSSVGNANVGNLGTAGLITATGNITGGNIIGTLHVGNLSGTGNSNVGNLGASGLITATGNITGGNIIGTLHVGNLSGTGNSNVGNLGVSGLITVTGNVTSGNLVTGGLITATGNITGGNLVTGGALSVTGNANIGNIGTTGLITATGNLNAGNIITAGSMYANSGIVKGQYLYGDGSNITNLNVTAGSSIVNGTSNVSIPSSGGNVNTVVAGNTSLVVTGTGANISGTVSVSGNISAANLLLSNAAIISANNMQLTTGANTNVGNITGNWSLTAGSRLNATYADLAEYYEADENYEPGTVLEFGGDKEVTIAQDGTTKVAGVVSTNPAYAMNAKCPGIAVAIALQGRVPTKVCGAVRKGDMMVSAGNGFARPWNNPQMGTVIGKALENFDGNEGVIEIAVGRL